MAAHLRPSDFTAAVDAASLLTSPAIGGCARTRGGSESSRAALRVATENGATLYHVSEPKESISKGRDKPREPLGRRAATGRQRQGTTPSPLLDPMGGEMAAGVVGSRRGGGGRGGGITEGRQRLDHHGKAVQLHYDNEGGATT
uniref:Uncharacterized protein n=1 Tax=Oryza punctata TaxID=4537 RepID=A0A0E0LUC4_ORYPU